MEPAPPVRFLDRTTPPHISTLILMTGVNAMAMNMFLPSLPSMTEYFQTEYRLTQLSVALFLAVNGVLQLFIGPLSDRYGRRPVTLWGFAIFALGSLGCIYAPTIHIFLFFRAVQASSVVAVVLSRASIRDVMETDRAASMIGYVTMGMAVVPLVTPALGGFLDQHFSWHANFWVFLITGVAVFALLWADFGETHHNRSDSFARQFRDIPALLASPRFWGYAGASACSAGGFYAYLGGAPFVGTRLFMLDPQILGIAISAPALGYMAGNYLSAAYAIHVGINRMILAGAIIALAGIGATIVLFAVGFGNAWTFFGMMTVLGLGNGMVIPNGIAGSLGVRPHLAGTASGLGGALMVGGGALLSGYAGTNLTEETGASTLLTIQFAVLLGSLASILMVIYRERQLARA